MLLGAFCIRQMANQVTVQLINVHAPEIVKLLAIMTENCGTDDHGNMDAFAIEYVAVHDGSPVLGLRDKGCASWSAKARLNCAQVSSPSPADRASERLLELHINSRTVMPVQWRLV